MIDRLSGVALKVDPTAVVLDLGGIAFRLTVPMSTSTRLSQGSRATLHTELIVREDSLALFGFLTEKERGYFNLLRSVAGIGPKLACTVLSGVSVEGLDQAVTRGEPGLLSRVPGVGRKTAARIVMELSSKIESVLRPTEVAGLASTEAVEALVSLGYQRSAAVRAVESACQDLDADASAEEVVRAALKTASAQSRRKS